MSKKTTKNIDIESMEKTIIESMRVSFAIEGHNYTKEEWDRLGKTSDIINSHPFFKQFISELSDSFD